MVGNGLLEFEYTLATVQRLTLEDKHVTGGVGLIARDEASL